MPVRTIRWVAVLTVLMTVILAGARLGVAVAYAAEKPSPPKLLLEDLGFKADEMRQDPFLQTQLEERANKLQTHQVTGLATLGLMALTVGLGWQASRNNWHQYLGAATSAAYWTTFYLAETAPKPIDPGNHGLNIKIHRAMTWFHVPLMVITPICASASGHPC